MLAGQEGANVRALCRGYGISAQTGYKWLARAALDPEERFADRSRRPRSSPRRTPAEVEAKVVALRCAHPRWGGRKLARRLRDLGAPRVPAPSTITAILRRHGRLDESELLTPHAMIRFERDRPNELWQMDFKGHFAHDAGRCHPLTLLDDHSRFSLCLEACANQRGATVEASLVPTFERYGLPRRMVFDNGSPWGNGPGDPYTPLGVWLLRLGIAISHSRPYHPQTLGKDERFHRSLKAEVLQGRRFRDLAHCRQAFAAWRHVYNLERPHEALDMAVPASRYRPSPRAYPPTLPAIEYAAGEVCMLYVIMDLDKPGRAKVRDDYRDDHLEYLDKAGEHVKLAGPLVSEDGESAVGSMIVYEGATLEEAEAFAAGDPYRIARLFDATIVKPWVWRRGNPDA